MTGGGMHNGNRLFMTPFPHPKDRRRTHDG